MPKTINQNYFVKTHRIFFIADDDLDDQELFIKALKGIEENCECITAFNGDDALQKLQGINLILPDIIFLDLNMPRLDGRQLLKEIKQIEELKNIPVIIYSTSADQTDIEETTTLGAAYFLQKPNRFEELSTALAQLLSRRW